MPFCLLHYCQKKDLYFRGKPKYRNIEGWATIGNDIKAQTDNSIQKLRTGPGKALMIQYVNLLAKSTYLASWSICIFNLCF